MINFRKMKKYDWFKRIFKSKNKADYIFNLQSFADSEVNPIIEDSLPIVVIFSFGLFENFRNSIKQAQELYKVPMVGVYPNELGENLFIEVYEKTPKNIQNIWLP